MGLYKDLLNQLAKSSSGIRKLTDLEMAAVRRYLLEMYQKIADVCRDNNLCLMFSGGSVLGAVRHQGFIPWDDDMDLNMPRADYDKLLMLLEAGALGDDYEFTYPSKEHDAPCAFLKIYRKGTKILGVGGGNPKYPQGIDIDIFPIEGVPSGKVSRWWKAKVADTLRLFANMVDESDPWSEDLKKFYAQDKYFYLFMRCRQLAGKLLSVISHKRWICWYDSFVKNSRIGELCSIPTGRRMYQGETLPAKDFFPVSKGTFEGMEVNLPANPDAYLRNLYGDYMQIPPEEKRESHMIIELQLPSGYQ